MADKIVFTTYSEDQLMDMFKRILNQVGMHSGKEPPETKKLLSRKDTAAYLGISLPTLSKLTKQGKLTAYRTGRQIRYNLHDLNKNLDTLKTKFK